MTENSIVVTRKVDGFAFIAEAKRQPTRHAIWTIMVAEVPTAGKPVALKDLQILNNDRRSVDMSHAPKHTGLVWEEIADMLDVALHETKGREAFNAGPYSDQQNKGPTS